MNATLPTVVDTSKLWNVPSFTQQEWKAGLFHFGKAACANTDYFNCGLVRRADALWLVTRRSVWDKRDRLGYNDVVSFALDSNLKPQVGRLVKLGQQWDIEHFEDPRAYFVNGKTYVSACNFIRNGKGCCYPHQVICEVENDWSLVKRHDPIYGANGSDTANNTSWEKNWGWMFVRFPIMLYKAHPHTVVEFGWDFKRVMIDGLTVDYVTDWDASLWQYGEVRGGTPPVKIGAEYWTFFHSSTKFRTAKRQYHMGAYAFESLPPYRITRITTKPLLSGSVHDRWSVDKPPAVFPVGSVMENREWLITFGVNDLDCGWCKIPHTQLVDKMTWL